MACLAFLAGTLRDRAGSVVAPVDRVVDPDRVVARVDGSLMAVRAIPIEVRHWPGEAEPATHTAGEARLPGNWIFAVAGGGLLLGVAGLLVPARPLRTRST